jgi:hypothetical protein
VTRLRTQSTFPLEVLPLNMFRLAAALAAWLPVLASAQPPAPAASTTEAPASSLTYRSAFQDLPLGVEETVGDWRKANADVGQFPRGHADLLRWEEQQGLAAPAVPASGAVPGKTPAPSGGQGPNIRSLR